jgi:hypothetical protein
MVVDTLAILSQHGTDLVSQLKQAISGHNATGRTARSLRFEVVRQGTKDILKVYGRPFIMALETGRKPTPEYTKPSRDFVESIREWLKAKGGDQSLSYAIAKSIHQKGTKGTPGIISNVVNSQVELIEKDILEQFAKDWLFNVVEFSNGNNRNSTSSRA